MPILSNSAEETEALGRRLARLLSPGDTVWLSGGLGAGKTALVRGLASGLGFDGRVTSPTFTVVNEYPGRIPLFHFDLYRLSGWDELIGIGWEDYACRGGVMAVEWSQRLDGLTAGWLVTMARSGDFSRVITVLDPFGNEVNP